MANNYTDSSSWLDIPADKVDAANAIIERVIAKLEADEATCGYCVCAADIEKHVDQYGVWFHGDESVDPEHVEMIARALVEELDLPGPFYCSWANTCSKPRVDEFGGGAFVLAKGVPTMRCDARWEVERKYAEYTESQQC